MAKTTIYVACHKAGVPVKRSTVYRPIHVGKESSKVIIGDCVADNVGDNISSKNPLYCEMTATYWAWKNDKESDYIGLCHYRRFFSFQRVSWIERGRFWLRLIKAKLMVFCRPNAESVVVQAINNPSKAAFELLTHRFEQEIGEATRTSCMDGFYLRPMLFPAHSVKTQFDTLGAYHNRVVGHIIETIYPDYYPFFVKVLEGNKISPCNMIILKRAVFDDYCRFVFGVLEAYEKQLLTDQWCGDLYKDKCVARLPGFMAEILTSVFITRIKSEGKHLKMLTMLNYGT